MALLDFPAALPTAAQDLPTLLDNLTERFLLGQATPFAWPAAELSRLHALEYRRLPGAALSSASARVPASLLAGLLGSDAPFAFVIGSDGEALHVAVGAMPGRAESMAQALHASLRGPPPVPWSPVRTMFQPSSAGCLSGQPIGFLNNRDAGLIDVLMDTLLGKPFFYAVYATPQPRNLIAEQLERVRTAADAVERTHLQPGRQAAVERNALRARQLLDRLATRLEHGLGTGLWRTSTLVGAAHDHVARTALATLCGGWSATESTAEAIVPLGAYLCSTSNPPHGHAVHHNVLTSAELSTVCALPSRDRFGFVRAHEASFDVDHTPGADALMLGQIVAGSRVTPRQFGVTPADLCRHALVTGMTGSGKSTTVRNLLSDLARRGIPFLVLEPAKAEYRQLAASIPNLVVLRAGAPLIQGELPFLFNPFYFPPQFRLHTHLDYLKQAFVASFGLFPPTPYLLETALYRVYENRGWSLVTGEHPRGHQRMSFPTLSDLLAEIDPVVDEAGYDSEISRNLKGALKTRLGNLCLGPKGIALDTRENLPEALLFERPVVIELRELGSDEEKALVMGLLLTRLFEYREAMGAPANPEELRHLLVLEEAHRLVRRTSEKSSEESNMAHQAVQSFCNLLAEIRAYGQGVAVVEQLPSKLATDVVKNSGLKIVHRLSPREDRDFVGDTMVLDEEQKREVAVLPPGVAIIHSGSMDGPVRIQVPAPRTASAAVASLATTAVLPADLRSRVDSLTRKAPLTPLLRSAALQRAADRFLVRVAAGHPFADEEAALSVAIDHVNLPAIPQLRPGDVRSFATRWAAAEAVLRRVLHYHWPDALLERLVHLLVTDGPRFVTEYRKALNVPHRPYQSCARCPSPCTALYEGKAAARDTMFLEDLVAAMEHVDSDARPREAWRAAEHHVDHLFDLPSGTQDALRFCVLREGLVQIGSHSDIIAQTLQSSP